MRNTFDDRGRPRRLPLSIRSDRTVWDKTFAGAAISQQRTLVAQRWNTITSRQTMSADRAIAARYLNGGCRAIGNGAGKSYA